MKSIILFGFKGSGKTYLGKRLSAAFQVPFIDTDDMIVKLFANEKHSIREIHGALGEVLFRDLEKKAVRELDKNTSAVIAVGGGAVLDRENAAYLETIGKLVYVKASFETIKERIFREGIPSFVDVNDPVGSLKQIYDARLPKYESLSALSLDVSLLSTEECVEVVKQYGL